VNSRADRKRLLGKPAGFPPAPHHPAKLLANGVGHAKYFSALQTGCLQTSVYKSRKLKNPSPESRRGTRLVERRLTVFVSKFSGVSDPQRMPAADAAALINGALRFVAKCRMNWHRTLEDSSEEFAFGELISSVDFAATATTVVVLTDHRCPKLPVLRPKIDGRDVTWSVWDLDRFHRLLTSGREREEITINFAAVGNGPIPFMKMPIPNPVYDTYLTMIPGDLLAELYREHGARLLEQNVRTFLQARGKVNRGIRDTILNHPEMFLAYNNGLCATAAHIELESEEGPVANILSVTNFQIVNGGQTTASLTSTLLKDDADLSGVLVQLKLSVIRDPAQVGTIVSNISRYANSQNKVSEADLLANDAFHVKVEHLSRTVWAPARPGGEPRDEAVLRAGPWGVQRREGQTPGLGLEAEDVRGRVPVEPVVHEDRPCQVREHLGRPASHRQPRRSEELRRVHPAAGEGPRAGHRVLPGAGGEGFPVPGGGEDRVCARVRGLPGEHRHLHASVDRSPLRRRDRPAPNLGAAGDRRAFDRPDHGRLPCSPQAHRQLRRGERHGVVQAGGLLEPH
jgi:hypothetical protein